MRSIMDAYSLIMVIVGTTKIPVEMSYNSLNQEYKELSSRLHETKMSITDAKECFEGSESAYYQSAFHDRFICTSQEKSDAC